jgi:Fur family transcriptional regulator, ferric uptake regulator
MPKVPKTTAPDETASRLKAAGLKVTQPRVAVLKALSGDHGPFTVEELKARIPSKTCDLVTLYRSLPALEKAGLVRRCDFGDGTVRYEYQEASGHHHHHVICRKCREVKSLDHCLIENLEKGLRKEGFTEITHSLEFFALCEKCS